MCVVMGVVAVVIVVHVIDVWVGAGVVVDGYDDSVWCVRC